MPSKAIPSQRLLEPGRWGLSPAVKALLAAGLVLRLLWVAVHPVEPISDMGSYHRLATTLAGDGIYGEDANSPEGFWPPGWPAALAVLYGLFGSDPQLGAAFGTVLEWAAIVLAAVAASRLLRPAFAVGAVAAMCLYPGGLFYSAVLGTEHLTALLFTGLVVLVAFGRPTPPTALAAGALTGALLLTRGDYGIAMIAVVAVWLVRGMTLRQGARVAGVALAGVLVFVGPWIARNAAQFDEFIPTATNGGVTFYLGTLGTRYTNSPVVERVYRRNSDMGPGAIDRRFWELGLENVAEDPLRWLKLDAQRIYSQYGYERAIPAWAEVEEWIPRAGAWLYWLAIMGFALVAIAGVVILRRRLPPPWLMIVASILAVSLLKTFFVVNERDRLPLTYLLIVVAALGAQLIVERYSGQLSRRQ